MKTAFILLLGVCIGVVFTLGIVDGQVATAQQAVECK